MKQLPVADYRQAHTLVMDALGPDKNVMVGNEVYENDQYFVVGFDEFYEGANPIAVEKDSGRLHEWHFTNSDSDAFFAGDYTTHVLEQV